MFKFKDFSNISEYNQSIITPELFNIISEVNHKFAHYEKFKYHDIKEDVFYNPDEEIMVYGVIDILSGQVVRMYFEDDITWDKASNGCYRSTSSNELWLKFSDKTGIFLQPSSIPHYRETFYVFFTFQNTDDNIIFNRVEEHAFVKRKTKLVKIIMKRSDIEYQEKEEFDFTECDDALDVVRNLEEFLRDAISTEVRSDRRIIKTSLRRRHPSILISQHNHEMFKELERRIEEYKDNQELLKTVLNLNPEQKELIMNALQKSE
ncbi:hypothetical protein [Vibrio phage phiKT1024]|nr:hypothetical protein [Vibrio phage phiKT1024]